MNQKNIVTIQHFTREYNKLSGAEATILGFEYKGIVYRMDFKHLPLSVLRPARESSKKGGYFKTKIYVTVANKKKFIANGKATPIMTLENLMEIETKKNTNKGHKFEKFFALSHREENLDWKEGGCDRFDKCGDVKINGIETQIKFEGASTTNINTIHNIQNERALAKRMAKKGLTK